MWWIGLTCAPSPDPSLATLLGRVQFGTVKYENGGNSQKSDYICFISHFKVENCALLKWLCSFLRNEFLLVFSVFPDLWGVRFEYGYLSKYTYFILCTLYKCHTMTGLLIFLLFWYFLSLISQIWCVSSKSKYLHLF